MRISAGIIFVLFFVVLLGLPAIGFLFVLCIIAALGQIAFGQDKDE